VLTWGTSIKRPAIGVFQLLLDRGVVGAYRAHHQDQDRNGDYHDPSTGLWGPTELRRDHDEEDHGGDYGPEAVDEKAVT
jgi:hypothetical protein